MICVFQDATGPVAIRADEILRIEGVAPTDEHDQELTTIVTRDLMPSGDDPTVLIPAETFVKTSRQEAIAEWERQLARCPTLGE